MRDAKDPNSRHIRLTPGWLVIGLLVLECVLWLSQRFEWFEFNRQKGWTVLIAVAAVGVGLLVMLLWFFDALFFHRRFQFGIRSLLVLTIVVAVPSSWLAFEMRKASIQHKAVAAIRALGGKVSYHSNAEEYCPRFLRDLLGDDFFGRVWGVSLSNHNIADADLWALENLPDISFIEMECPTVTDAGLGHLRGLRQLRTLIVFESQVAGSGLESLTGLTGLILSCPRFADAGLDSIKHLTNLRELDLYKTSVSDAGLVKLRGLSRLQSLGLAGTKVTAEGIAELRKSLPQCEITR